MHDVSRPQWRDAIKADQRLSANDVLVGLLIADYWATDSTDPFWAAIDRLIPQSRLSRAAVFRAIKSLREAGFLRQVSAAKHNHSPRWEATLNAEQSHTETVQSQQETNSSHTDTRDLKNTTRTPNSGSSDLDSESQATFVARPTCSEEAADYELLRAHMHNYNAEGLATVYGWLRTGERTGRAGAPGKPWEFPGAVARKMHAKKTKVEDVSSWQGFFRRMVHENSEASYPAVRHLPVDDPWATKKSA